MIVFVAGMSRAGSMWTYNVVRAIYETGNYSVLPKVIPIDEKILINNALLSMEKEKEVYCIKTHFALSNPLPTKHRVKFICNIRDVRDACLSFMRFMHADFEAGVTAMKSMMAKSDYYLNTFKDNLIEVRFEDMTNTPLAVLERICVFLGIELSESEKQSILAKYDKSNIKKELNKLSEIRVDDKGRVIGEENSSRFNTVRNFDGTYRVYDTTTAFQSNHITSSKDGEWRTYFDENRLEKINELSKEWLLNHGYKI